MKILFTGGSSFTGFWFIKELVRAGHEVYATFTASGQDVYSGIRAERVRQLAALCVPVWGCNFGDEGFLDLIRTNPNWDLLCHHAADVTNYKSQDFDVGAALSANTANLGKVLPALAAAGCTRVVLTGSVFEQHEGVGEQPLRAFSPYGLSKGLTSEVFRYWCGHYGFSMGKFVIPNPFGPYEEPRFTTYLARTWLQGKRAGVNTPYYVRDNIHVSLLALAYGEYVARLGGGAGPEKYNPSGYVESQGAFARRFAAEMQSRLGVVCELDMAGQQTFEEPKMRVNCDRVDAGRLGWDESAAWDALAEYYLKWLGR